MEGSVSKKYILNSVVYNQLKTWQQKNLTQKRQRKFLPVRGEITQLIQQLLNCKTVVLSHVISGL